MTLPACPALTIASMVAGSMGVTPSGRRPVNAEGVVFPGRPMTAFVTNLGGVFWLIVGRINPLTLKGSSSRLAHDI